MSRRSQAQIEKDYIKIKKALKTAKNFREICEITGLKYNEIVVSLKKHPRVYDRIKKQIKSVKNIKDNSNLALDKEQYIVIDASVTGIPDVEEMLENDERKIIMTSITIRELNKIGHHENAAAVRARHILRMAGESSRKFVHKLIREDLKTPDDCILDFCIQNRDNIVLYTADNEMCNLAKAYFISVKLLSVEMENKENPKIVTLHNLVCIGKNLLMDLNYANTNYRMVKVISNGKEYDKGMVELNIGDDVLVARKKETDYFTFAHYKIISLSPENNCNLIYSRRVENNYAIKTMNFNSTYKSFLYKFKSMIN